MQMTEKEIIESWRRAGKSKQQVEILADLNACPKKKIEGIIVKAEFPTVFTCIEIPEAIRALCADRLKVLDTELKKLDETITLKMREKGEIEGFLKSGEKR